VPKLQSSSYAANIETASLLRLATIQRIERKEDLTDLSPKHCFIAAEAIECAIGQIGEAQKAPGELGGRTFKFHCGTCLGFYFMLAALRRMWVKVARAGRPEYRMYSVSRAWEQLTALPILVQMVSLNLK